MIEDLGGAPEKIEKGYIAKLEAKSCDNKGIGIFASVLR